MNKNRFAKRVAVAAGFFFLCAVPGLARAQSSPPTPAPTPHKTLPVARPKRDTRPTDDFAGLQYTDEQRARIDQIHQDLKVRMDAVVKDEKLAAEQRDAMVAGVPAYGAQPGFQGANDAAAERSSQEGASPARGRARGAEEAVSAKVKIGRLWISPEKLTGPL